MTTGGQPQSPGDLLRGRKECGATQKHIASKRLDFLLYLNLPLCISALISVGEMTEYSPLMSAPEAGLEAETPPKCKGLIDTDSNLVSYHFGRFLTTPWTMSQVQLKLTAQSMSSLSFNLDDPPATMTPFLSEDILISVANQLDLPSALSLARVSRVCARAAQYRIWRDINLAYPSYDASALSPAKIAADKARLNERVSMIRAQAGDKGTFVRSVTWSSQAVWAEAMQDVLEAVADSVESIEVSVRVREPGDVKRPRHVPPFDAIVHAQPQLHRFDKLTSVIMGSDSIRLSGFIPVLLDVAPNISTLDIRTDLLPLSRTTGPTPNFIYSTPRLITWPTKLQRLGLYLSEPSKTSSPTSFYGPAVEPQPADPLPIDTILSLLRNSPDLQQLYLQYNPRLFAEVNAVTSAITGLKSLIDLRWTDLDGCQHHGAQRYPAAGTDATDAAVERLVLWPWKYFDVTLGLPVSILHTLLPLRSG
jgi:hypothetical protein